MLVNVHCNITLNTCLSEMPKKNEVITLTAKTYLGCFTRGDDVNTQTRKELLNFLSKWTTIYQIFSIHTIRFQGTI